MPLVLGHFQAWCVQWWNSWGYMHIVDKHAQAHLHKHTRMRKLTCTSTHAHHMWTHAQAHKHARTHAQARLKVIGVNLFCFYIGSWGKSPVCFCACMYAGVVCGSLFCMTMFHVRCLSLCMSWWCCHTLWHCICCGLVGQCLVYVCLLCGMVDWWTGEAIWSSTLL